MVSWNFSLTWSFRSQYGPEVDSASNRNEYREYFLGVNAAGAYGWSYHHPVPLSRKVGTLTSWNPLGHSTPATGLLYHLLNTFTNTTVCRFPETRRGSGVHYIFTLMNKYVGITRRYCTLFVQFNISLYFSLAPSTSAGLPVSGIYYCSRRVIFITFCGTNMANARISMY
jgi:hypothetical protein